MHTLFVCKGNMGRSQLAEAFYNKLAAGTGHRATSAGYSVPSVREGEAVPPYIQDILLEHGADPRGHTRKKFTEGRAAEADRIVWLGNKPRIWLPRRSLPEVVECHLLIRPWLWKPSGAIPSYIPPGKLERWTIPDGAYRSYRFNQAMAGLLRQHVEGYFSKHR